ncbi:SusC/RagA family protein, partial [Bacteroides xylanisolvens]
MKKIQVLFFALLICLFAANLYAQEQGKISGKILSTLNIPIEGAVISVTGSEDVTTDKNGVFQIQCKDPQKANISVWAAGYYTVFQAVNNRKEMSIILIPESEYKYNETTVLP